MNSDYISIEDIAGQYVDLLNIIYISMTREKRLKNLSSLAKRITDFRYDHDHKEIKKVVNEAVEEQLNLIAHSSSNSVFIGVEYKIFRYSFGVMPSYLLNIFRNWV